MFARAVEEHDAVNNLNNWRGGNVDKQLRATGSPGERSDHSRQSVLKPSSLAALNSSRGSSCLSNQISLKRTASQAECEAPLRYTTPSSTVLAQPHMSAGHGILNNLHAEVFFDENDFSDDNDLGLDLDSKSTGHAQYPSLSTNPTTPLPSQIFAKPNSNPPVEHPELLQGSAEQLSSDRHSKTLATSSSVPIEWSSSPVSHKAPLSNAALLHRSASGTEAAREKQVTPILEPVTRMTRRRNLPWLKSEKNEFSTLATAQGQEGIKNQSRGRPRLVKEENEDPFTPLPKNTAQAAPLWNKTASAIKDEQKRHRQKAKQGKKLAKQGEDGPKGVSKTKSRAQNMAPVFLSEEQRKVLDLVVEANKSVFFTGSAGTGKSVLMKDIISDLRKKYKREPDRVAVTASTGLAACHIGGVTLHSFAGIGIGRDTAEQLVKKIRRNAKAKNRWMRTKVLIIDEISMVDGALFDKLERIARAIRNNGRPFGGIQLVLTGDFFQLPPVPDSGREATFAFDAATWSTSIEHTIGLTQVFRQKDPAFASMLNEMRIGKLSRESINTFSKLNRKLSFVDDVEATELFPRRNEVDNANNVRMQQLGGRSYTYNAQDGGTMSDEKARDRLLTNCMAPQSITLKKGAQVMLIKNLDDSLVNGSTGRVLAFMDERTYDHYVEDEDQFQPLDAADIDSENANAAREKLKSMYNKEGLTSTSQLWPVVRFNLNDGTFRDLLCVRETWKNELPNGEIQAQRCQIPLILAWALSIHKAQGQTLERVRVDLGNIFEKGQAYVALSRATTQEGLQIMRFDPRKVMAHDKVRRFYDSLYSANKASSTAKPSMLSRPTTSDSTIEEELALEDFYADQTSEEAHL